MTEQDTTRIHHTSRLDTDGSHLPVLNSLQLCPSASLQIILCFSSGQGTAPKQHMPAIKKYKKRILLVNVCLYDISLIIQNFYDDGIPCRNLSFQACHLGLLQYLQDLSHSCHPWARPQSSCVSVMLKTFLQRQQRNKTDTLLTSTSHSSKPKLFSH